jgi:hypothetical protein
MHVGRATLYSRLDNTLHINNRTSCRLSS